MRYIAKISTLAILGLLSLAACELQVSQDGVTQGDGRGKEDPVDCAHPVPDFNNYSQPDPNAELTPSELRKRAAVGVMEAKCIGCHASRGNMIPNQMYNDVYWNDPCNVPHSLIGFLGDPADAPMLTMLQVPLGTGISFPNNYNTNSTMPQGGTLTASEFTSLWNFVAHLGEP